MSGFNGRAGFFAKGEELPIHKKVGYALRSPWEGVCTDGCINTMGNDEVRPCAKKGHNKALIDSPPFKLLYALKRIGG